jgi:hypothetical protein
VQFKVTYVESYTNGDFFWEGDLVSPDTCIDGQDTSICDYGYLLLMRKDNRHTGSITLGDSLYYQFRDLGDSLTALILLEKDSFFRTPLECSTPLSASIPLDTTTTVPDSIVADRSSCPAKVLVLYTEAAVQQYPDITDLIDLAMFDVNKILKRSEVYPHQLEIQLAGTAEVAASVWEESDDIIFDVNTAIANPTLQSLRSQFAADLVVILTEDDIHAEAVGAVTSFGDALSAADSAYTVIEAGSVIGPWFSFSHEIGHLFGCRHERRLECMQLGDDSGLPDAHGWVIDKNGWFGLFGLMGEFNTIMAVCNRGAEEEGNLAAGVNGNPRITHFSNPNVRWAGKRTGRDGTNYNARILRNAACRIANYDVSESPIVSFEFPDKSCPGLGVNGSVEIYNVPPPWQCSWEHSYDGFNWSTPTVNDCSGYYAIMPPSAGARLYIRVTAGNVNGPMMVKHTDILADNSQTNCPRQGSPGEYEKVILATPEFLVFPNPAKDQLNIRYSTGLSDSIIDMKIYSSQGQLLMQKAISPSIHGGSESVKLNSLTSGTYILVLQGKGYIYKNLFVILN